VLDRIDLSLNWDGPTWRNYLSSVLSCTQAAHTLSPSELVLAIISLPPSYSFPQKSMTVIEAVKDAVGLDDSSQFSTHLGGDCNRQLTLFPASSSSLGGDRQAMANARLPLPYRDSCAHLLIPLNKCRVDEYYLPWKCEVRSPTEFWESWRDTDELAERTT
jgi:hypothetical protein